jgi:CRP-like cAMP-binding protein
MNISKQQHGDSVNKDILRDLIPFNALSEERYRDLAGHLEIQDIEAGSCLFSEGDNDNRAIYLLDGVVNLIDSRGQVEGVITAGKPLARYPLANQQPRTTTARATTKSVIASIDPTLLDIMLTLDQSADSGVIKTTTGNGKGWITRMLQSEAFTRLTPSDIQRLLQSLESVPVRAGEVVIREGDPGDYFYIVREGRCGVTRLSSGGGWEIPVAKLTEGDCFGEEALVSDAQRNATVTMLSDGNLMRLSKKSFVELLKKPLLQYIDYNLALVSVEAGDVWLDVRLKDEYLNYSLPNSVNAPLAQIRDKANILDNTKKYIIYCDTGRRSAAAAFILGQHGFDVCVLEGGLNNIEHTDAPGRKSDVHPGNAAAGTIDHTAPNPETAPTDHGLHAVIPQAPGHMPAAEDETTASQPQQDPALEEVLSGLRAEVDDYLEQIHKIEAACKKALQARDTITAQINRLSRQAPSSKQS